MQAYRRADFFSAVALPPLTAVGAYGAGGYRQEFQDAARSGQRFALIRPANPNLSAGVNNIVRQVRPPVYAILNRSSIGVSTAGFPLIDTTEFLVLPPGEIAQQAGGTYQTFDKNFAIFVWLSPPLAGEGSDSVEFTVADPIYTKWQSISMAVLGPPVSASATVTSRFATAATAQRFAQGAIYALTSGAFTGRAIFVRANVLSLYLANQAQSGFLGLPIADEIVLPDGRRRQSFEGGTVEYALNGIPVIKNAVQTVSIASESPLRVTAGQSVPLVASLQTSAGEIVEDREVFWTSSNGLIASIAGTGPRVTLRALRGGTAVVTATSEGKSSRSLTVFVSGLCCAIGEGAPTQNLSQTFIDAVQRNRLSLRQPLAAPVRRLGAGYAQEAFLIGSGQPVLLAKPDSTPLAFVLSGSLLSAHAGLGGLAGSLGYPTSDVSSGGTQTFEGGALAGSPVQVVSGPILARWRTLGLETGALGRPLSPSQNVLSFAGSAVTSQRFAAGLILQYNAGPLFGRAFVLAGPIAAKYVEIGGAAGLAGGPLSEEFQVAGTFRQDFEGATLEYNPGTGVRVLEKARRPVLSVSPSSVLPGGRYRVSVGGFPANTRLRISQAGPALATFEATAATGAYVWETSVAPDARNGLVVVRAVDGTNAQIFAEGSFTIRTLAELRPQLTKVAGDQQSAPPGTLLGVPIRIQVRDSSGNPLAAVAVRFEASPGGAILSASAQTDAEGMAQASWRLPSQSGVAVATVQAGGQSVSFAARAEASSIANYPRLTQSIDGNLGSSASSIRSKGSLLAALAALVRFNQQRALAPSDAGLADVGALNAYLTSFCIPDSGGVDLCDGYLDAGPGTDPIPNPLRLNAYSSGVLDFEPIPPTLDALRQSVAAELPVVLAMEMSRNGAVAGAHFVTATGVTSTGDVQIVDSNPSFALPSLQPYLNGFPSGGATWQAKLVSAFRFVPRGAQTSSFFVHGSSAFEISGGGPSCSRAVSWPSQYAAPEGSVPTTNFHLQACDGTASTYQLDTPGPFLLTFTSLTNPPVRRIVSGALATAYAIQREAETWTLGPMSLQLSAAGAVNAASFEPRFAPGAIVSLFGAGLPKSTAAMSNSVVEFNGSPLPIFFSNGFQLNTALPEDAAPGAGSLRVVSAFGEQTLSLNLLDSAPGIFSLGPEQGAVVNGDGNVNSASFPAQRGQAIVIYATGLGRTEGTSNNLRSAVNRVAVQLDGQSLNPFFAGLTPGFIGLYQVNVLIPATQTPGLNLSLSLESAGIVSNFVRIAVR